MLYMRIADISLFWNLNFAHEISCLSLHTHYTTKEKFDDTTEVIGTDNTMAESKAVLLLFSFKFHIVDNAQVVNDVIDQKNKNKMA